MTEIIGNELLQGERIYLDAIRKEDSAQAAGWFADMELQRLLERNIVFPHTIEDHEDFYEQQRQARRDASMFAFNIRRKDEGVLIGGCLMVDFNWQARHAMVALFIGDRNLWGKGYGTDALRVLLRYGFMELNLNRIGLGVFSYNTRAIKSCEKIGFQHEGRMREMICRDGKYHDEILMSILRSEWEEHGS